MTDQTARFDRYPLAWRLFDALDGNAERFLPRATTRVMPFLMLLPALAMISLLVFGLAFVAEQSFHVLDTATLSLGPSYSLGNYLTVLSRSHYRELVGRSIGTAVVVATLCLVLAFPYAYVMVRAKRPAMKKLLLCCIFFPFLLGAVVRGFAWLVVLGRDGLINSALHALGLPSLPLVYNMTGVLIGMIQLYLPLAIMMIAPALTAIEEDIDEAAQSLGAPWLRALWTVILPMARPGLISAFVIVLTLAFSDMAIPTILGGGRADFITNAIYDSYLETGDTGIGAALCVLTTVISLGMIILFFVWRSALAARRMRSNA